jgi:hypothetical protein
MNRTAIERELRVFDRFAAIAPLAIDASSIQSRAAPQPDIICRSLFCGSLAFELVELIDEDYARRTAEMMKTQVMLRDLPERLPGSLRDNLRTRLNDPLIFLHYKPGIPLRDREGLAIEALWRLCDIVVHNPKFDPEDGVYPAFESIRLHAWPGGLRIECSSAGFVADPTIDRLRDKFGKRYTSEEPMHLLMYTEIDLLMPDDVWLPAVDPFVQDHIKESAFRRVWLFKSGIGRIEYVFPPLDD